VENPPEAVSLTFNDDGQVREITTGYPVDRLCGTSGGLGGLFGILEGLGYPLPVPLTRPCSENIRPIVGFLGLEDEFGPTQVPVVGKADALPEEKLFELTERLIESRFGIKDTAVLADSFISAGPFGPTLRKDKYLELASSANISEAFPDVDYRWRDFRICPFDVNRVWYTCSPAGTHSADLNLGGEVLRATGRCWRSPPECGSATFDADGKCVYVTSGYVMDRRVDNTNGEWVTLTAWVASWVCARPFACLPPPHG